MFATFSCKYLALDRIFKVHNFSEFLTTGQGKLRVVGKIVPHGIKELE